MISAREYKHVVKMVHRQAPRTMAPEWVLCSHPAPLCDDFDTPPNEWLKN